MISRGKVRALLIQETSGAAGSTGVHLRPGSGVVYRVLYAIASHADVGARSCAWYLTDPEGAGIALTASISLDPAAVLPITAIAAAGSPLALGELKATSARYYSFVFDASAGAKVGTIRAIVEEYPGSNEA